MLLTVNSAETKSLMAYFTTRDVALYALGIGCYDVDEEDGNEKDGDKRNRELRYIRSFCCHCCSSPNEVIDLRTGCVLSHQNPWLISLTTGRAAGSYQGDSTGTNLMQITCVTCKYCIVTELDTVQRNFIREGARL